MNYFRIICWMSVSLILLGCNTVPKSSTSSNTTSNNTTSNNTTSNNTTSNNTTSNNTTPGIDRPNSSLNQPVLVPELVDIPAGIYIMGDQVREGDEDEGPAHEVSIEHLFISKYELTVKEYTQFTKETNRLMPSNVNVSLVDHPITNVSWHDAVAYTQWLSKKTKKSFSLPTEAEWEYIARAGAMTLYANGNKDNQLCDIANIADRTAAVTKPHWETTQCTDNVLYISKVGRYRPNDFGVYDMHGNVWEWTADCYKNSYQLAPSNGTKVESTSCAQRVIRGGSYQLPATSARLSNREALSPSSKEQQIGFRIVLHP